MRKNKITKLFLVSTLILSSMSVSTTSILAKESKVTTTFSNRKENIEKKDKSTKAEIKYSGKKGDCPWTYDTEGVLTLEGGGRYPGISVRDDHGTEIVANTKKVVIEGEVLFQTGIFDGYEKLEEIVGWEKTDLFPGTTSLNAFFKDCKKLKAVDVGHWNVSEIMNFNTIFKNCESLKELDLTGWGEISPKLYVGTFEGAMNLEKLNIANFSTANPEFLSNLGLRDLFKGTVNLKELTLGPNFDFSVRGTTDPGLSEITQEGYTGKWMQLDGDKIFDSTADFIASYNGKTDAGTYVWQTENEAAEEGTVTVKYVDASDNDKELIPSIDLVGEIGSPYTTEAQDIEHYTLIHTPENATGVYSSENQTVVYQYEANDAAPVTVEYKNQLGNEIQSSTITTGKYGETVTISAPSISGYQVSGDSSKEVTLSDQEQTITFNYEGLTAPKLTVEYVDENGEEVHEPLVVETGQVGDAYTTEPIEIDGYTLSQIPENATGFRPYEEVTVTYEYSKDQGIPFDLNYVGVQQQEVVGFIPENVETNEVKLYVQKNGTTEWMDTGYSAVPDKETGYFAIDSRFVKGTRNFLLANQDTVKVEFVSSTGDKYESTRVVEPYAAPVVNDYYEGEEFLTGMVQNGANQVRLNVNGINQRVVYLSSMLNNDRGISALTGEFSIYAQTWHDGPDYYDSKIDQVKAGAVLTVDYGVQIYGNANNPSTTLIVKAEK